MKTLYIECNMGAAGDMLTAALLELLPDADAFIAQMNAAGIEGMCMRRSEKTMNGLRGTHISVSVHGAEEISADVDAQGHSHAAPHAHLPHSHCDLAGVGSIIGALNLPQKVKEDAMGVYALIAEAEAYVHGSEAAHIHFHELGMMDAIADVCAVCLLMYQIGAQRVVVSPVCTGFGEVRCMHGVVPVPAPATAYLLSGMPAYAGHIRGELLTPTGCALLKYFADEFGQMPPMTLLAHGCGMGSKEFESANCVRVFLGKSEDVRAEASRNPSEVVEISCNIDDMTGEALSYACQTLLNAGALDVYSLPIQMKKGRHAVKLCCVCAPEEKDRFADLMLLHTTTLGVRMQRMQRKTLSRKNVEIPTEFGAAQVKFAEGEGVRKHKAEYESIVKIARENNVPLSEVVAAVERALSKQ